jgi:hypothetical protein
MLPCTNTRVDATQTPEHKNKRNQMFTQFDPNGNGYLSLAEVDKVSTESRMMPRFVQEHVGLYRNIASLNSEFRDARSVLVRLFLAKLDEVRPEESDTVM